MRESLDSVFLTASAGSGKTFALCARYLALLLSGVPASEILTLTFTIEAANEMKTRITRNLRLLYLHKHDENPPKEVLDLQKALEAYGFDSSRIKAAIDGVYHTFLGATKRISTIDSFFASILRSFAFYAGVRQDFRVEEKSRADKYLSLFLESSYKDPSLRSILRYLYSDLGVKSKSYEQGTPSLGLLLAELHDKSIECGGSLPIGGSAARIEALALKCGFREIEGLVSQDLLALVFEAAANLEAYLREIAPQKPNGNLDKIYAGLVSQDLSKIIKEDGLVKKRTHSFIEKSIKPNESQASTIARLCERVEDLAVLWNLVLEDERFQALSALSDSYAKGTEDIHTAENSLSFQAIKQRVFSLMTNELYRGANFNSDYFYFRLDSKISHILFDEYQDTSIMQFRIFAPLFEEMMAGSGTKQGKSLFFVGDSKQSMYAFRGASPVVFEEGRARLREACLDYNYRSKEHIIDFVNEKFACIFSDYVSQKYPGDSKDKGGVVQVSIYDRNTYEVQSKDGKSLHYKTKESMQNRELEKHAFAEIAACIKQLLDKGVASRDIALLARRRDVLQDFVQHASIALPQVRFNLDNNGKLIDQRFIKIIYYGLRIQDYNEILKTKAPSNEYNEEQKESLTHRRFAKRALAKLLNRSYSDEVALPSPSKKDLAVRIKELIELFCLYNEDAMLLLELAIGAGNQNSREFFQSIAHKDSVLVQEEAIQVLTVHGAKGLGFKHVIYIDTKSNGSSREDKILYDYEGLKLKEVRLDNHKDARDESLASLADRLGLERGREECNILYVACTRAKEGLYIFANKDGYSAKSLNLDTSDSRGELDVHVEEEISKPAIAPLVISSLIYSPARQTDFLHKDPWDYSKTVEMRQKQLSGLVAHASLELRLGFGMQDPLPPLLCYYGFFVEKDELDRLLRLTENLVKQNLGGIDLAHAQVKSEVSIIEGGERIQRLDALVKQNDELYILEFKTSKTPSQALIREHAAQLGAYKDSLEKIAKGAANPPSIKGYIVYLHDTPVLKEI